MTFCAIQTRLLSNAGRELAEKLLPEPFKLWFSDHSTGIQMTIVAVAPGSSHAHTVWQGSVWHDSVYEFNDRDKTPGLQPEFEWASEIIGKYFEDVRCAVVSRDAIRAAEKQSGEARAHAVRCAELADIRRVATA